MIMSRTLESVLTNGLAAIHSFSIQNETHLTKKESEHFFAYFKTRVNNDDYKCHQIILLPNCMGESAL